MLANASVASASRALNGIGPSPATLAQVMEAAEAVGYVPNAAAHSLRSRRTGRIAFAMPDVPNPVYMTMVSPIHELVRERGWRLLLHSTGPTRSPSLLLRDVKNRDVDGLIQRPAGRRSIVIAATGRVPASPAGRRCCCSSRRCFRS